MAQDLKSQWKQAGKELGSAFSDLGKTIVKTGVIAAKKVYDWANSEDTATGENQPNQDQE